MGQVCGEEIVIGDKNVLYSVEYIGMRMEKREWGGGCLSRNGINE